jgi:Zn-dependent oligopeptidase
MKFFASSMLSLKCFSGGVKNTKMLRESIEKEFLQGIYCDPESNKEASFLHLAEHFYRSKFYVYFWADVFAYNTYDRIIDLTNSGISDAWLQFRKQVLDHGGALDPNAAALQFLGRPPQIEVYLKKITS